MARPGSANSAEGKLIPEQLDERSLELEFERLRLERQKISIDMMLRRHELNVTTTRTWSTFFSNPILLTVVGGFITLMTTTIASHISTTEAIRAETAKTREALQAELIKTFLVGASPSAVRSNLQFLLNVGLVPNYARNLETFLRANPDSALPNLARRTCGQFLKSGISSQDVDFVESSYAEALKKMGLHVAERLKREISPDGSWSVTADFGPCE